MDPEIKAMNEAWEAIARLPGNARIRVIRYLAGRAAMNAAGEILEAGSASAQDEAQPELNLYVNDSGESGNRGLIEDRLRALFVDREISTTANKILVAAAMIQKDAGGKPRTAREIHEPLRRAGVSITNISAHLNAIHERSGRRMIVKIAEKNRHHRYQVTATGQRAVEQLLDA